MKKNDVPCVPIVEARGQYEASLTRFIDAVNMLQSVLGVALSQDCIDKRVAPDVQKRLDAVKQAWIGE